MKKDLVIYNLREIIKEFPATIQQKIAFAGGCIRDMLLDEKIKDYDLFCADEWTQLEVVSFLNSLVQNNPDKNKYKILNSNDFLANFIIDGKFIQVIKNKYYDLSTTELIDSFDYTITCAMVTMDNFFYHKDFFEHVLTKRLAINKITYPLSTLERLQKYNKKGYYGCNGTLLEIAKSLSGLQFIDKPEENDKNNSLVFYPDGSPRFLGID